MLHQPQAHLTISPEMVPSLVTITLLLMWKQTTEGRGDALVIKHRCPIMQIPLHTCAPLVCDETIRSFPGGEVP